MCGIDHLHARGDSSLEELDVVAGIREPIGTEADASYLNISEFHGFEMVSGSNKHGCALAWRTIPARNRRLIA